MMNKYVPAIDSDWWRLCEMPDLGELSGADVKKQNIVDHGFIQAQNGQWQLWACIRGTGVSRLIYGWRGDSLENGPWEPVGVMLRADESCGETVQPAEKVGAPFFFKDKGRYYCFYHSTGIHLLESDDGIHYSRRLNQEGSSLLFDRPAGRDAMVMKIDDEFFCYTCVSTMSQDELGRSFVMLRRSKDLVTWSDYTNVCEGGRAGNGVVASESPFVVKHEEQYYLFRASSIDFKTYVYCSETPFEFGFHSDAKLIATFPIKAPEIILHEGQYYISDLADFQGIKLARLRWDRADTQDKS